MKIKLGSIITEAKGVIGGHYVANSRWGQTLSRKRNTSGQNIRNRANNWPLIQFQSYRWTQITEAQRNTWISYYGSKLKGFQEFRKQRTYRTAMGQTNFPTVTPTSPNAALSFVNFAYTEATQTITISLTSSGATTGLRMIQIRNYSPTRSVVGNSGWLQILTVAASQITPINISTPIKATGRQVTNNTTFQLRVIQAMSNDHPLTITSPVTIQTGA